MKVRTHDPHVSSEDPALRSAGVRLQPSIASALKGADAVLILTDHAEYRSLTANRLKRLGPTLKVLVDTRHLIEPSEARKGGLVYRGVGRGDQS